MTAEPHDRQILFITRKWHGHGGMQRLSRDLDRELSVMFAGRYSCVHPAGPGIAALILFMLRAFTAGVRCGKAGGYVHLGDAALLPLGAWISRVSGARLSMTACGLDVLYPSALYQWLLRRSIPSARRIACISEATAQAVRERGAEAGRVNVIPCGISINEPVCTEREPRTLLTVGRLVPRKGVAWFIERVFPELRKLYPDLRYIIAGAGPEEGRIRRLIETLHLSPHIELKTGCDDAACAGLMRRASLFVMPNIAVPGDMEGFGIVAIEAAARGLPVCAARIEGVRDAVLEGETGCFFKPGDVRDCLAVLGRMLEFPLMPADVARAARARYAWDGLVTLYRTHVFS